MGTSHMSRRPVGVGRNDDLRVVAGAMRRGIERAG